MCHESASGSLIHPVISHPSYPTEFTMLPILFHIPLEIAGVPLFGWGLLLAVWAVFSVGLMIFVVRQQGWTADTWGYLPILVIVAAILIWVLPAICDAEGLPIRGYGVMVLCGVLSAVGAGRASRPARGDPARLDDLDGLLDRPAGDHRGAGVFRDRVLADRLPADPRRARISRPADRDGQPFARRAGHLRRLVRRSWRDCTGWCGPIACRCWPCWT